MADPTPQPSRAAVALSVRVRECGGVRACGRLLDVGEGLVRGWLSGQYSPRPDKRRRIAELWPEILPTMWDTAPVAKKTNPIPQPKVPITDGPVRWRVIIEVKDQALGEKMLSSMAGSGHHSYLEAEPLGLEPSADDDPRRLSLAALGFCERILASRPHGRQLHVGLGAATALLNHARWQIEQMTPETIMAVAFDGDAGHEERWLLDRLATVRARLVKPAGEAVQ